jgi:hypothetical protein
MTSQHRVNLSIASLSEIEYCWAVESDREGLTTGSLTTRIPRSPLIWIPAALPCHANVNLLGVLLRLLLRNFSTRCVGQ